MPLERAFTYSVAGDDPAVGARVLVPFSGQRLMGVVLRVHSNPPAEGITVKPVQQVLDEAALLPDELMHLAEWIAQYYIAPLGEVLRGMLPLTAEIRRTLLYRIAEQGRTVLHEGAAKGSSRRSRLAAEEQNREYAVLNALESGTVMKLAALRSATGANKALLEGMVRKRWLMREAEAVDRDARRLEKVVHLVEEVRLPKLNANQMYVLQELAAAGGPVRLATLRAKLQERTAINERGESVTAAVPNSTLATLAKRGLVRVEDAPRVFRMGGLLVPGKKHAHEHVLNVSQAAALHAITRAIDTGGFVPHLLYGVTGSGKTAVYIGAMRHALDAGKAALLLVPEIGLTPAMVGQVQAAFVGQVALLHSQLTLDERAEQWHRIRRGHARVVVGTRSAIFAPLRDLELILVDEEHDGSYKQEETPRYHGRDVAVMRAKLLGVPVVLGSATPSMESWVNAERGRYALLRMTERVNRRPLPAVELVDMRAEFRETGADTIFSRALIEEIHSTLDRGEQAIILQNRRGYSYVTMCRSCGAKVECENCAISMTLHRSVAGSDMHAPSAERLECHYCGFQRAVPKQCPACKSEHLYFFGAGSQQGEERLQQIFPRARIGRMDRDTIRGRADMEHVLQRLHSGEINLLIGTQMIAKGHDIHGVTTVGVVGCDHALGLPDFRAAERVFELITQVSGRAGRGDAPGRVLVQTYHPEHYAMDFAAKHDYEGFIRKEKNFRRPFFYPPYGVLANVVIQSEKLEEANAWAGILGRWLGSGSPGVRVLGPSPSPISRLKRIHRFHLVLKAEKRPDMQRTVRAMLAHAHRQQIPRKALMIDVDALSLM